MQKIFPVFFPTVPLLHPPVLLFVGGMGSGGGGHNVNTHRAAMMLIMFPKHIFGPYPHGRERSIYPFFSPPYHTVSSATFMTVSAEVNGRGGGGGCWIRAIQVEKSCQVKAKNSLTLLLKMLPGGNLPYEEDEEQISWISSINMFPPSSSLLPVCLLFHQIDDVALIVFHLWWQLSRISIRNNVWSKKIQFSHSIHLLNWGASFLSFFHDEPTVSRCRVNKRPLRLRSTELPSHSSTLLYLISVARHSSSVKALKINVLPFFLFFLKGPHPLLGSCSPPKEPLHPTFDLEKVKGRLCLCSRHEKKKLKKSNKVKFLPRNVTPQLLLIRGGPRFRNVGRVQGRSWRWAVMLLIC